MTGLLRYARSEDVPLPQNTAHRFAAQYALVHYPSGAICSFILKNAFPPMRSSKPPI